MSERAFRTFLACQRWRRSCRNDVQAGGQTEADAADERIGKQHARQIDVGVRPQESRDLHLRSKEPGHGIVRRRRRTGRGRRFHRGDVHAASVNPSSSACALRSIASNGLLERFDIRPIALRHVSEHTTIPPCVQGRESTPPGDVSGQQCLEQAPMVGHAKVQQLVDDDVVLKTRLPLSEIAGQRDRSAGRTGSPFPAHRPHANDARIHAQLRRPREHAPLQVVCRIQGMPPHARLLTKRRWRRSARPDAPAPRC